MNAKTCKRLRRQAQAATIGETSVFYDVQPELIFKINGVRTTRTLAHNCTRAAYHRLKNEASAR